MILKGRPRAGGNQLANYLLSPKNEQVRVLDVRGTLADERNATGLKQSLREMDELGKMTRAQSSLFHLAINPSDRDRLSADDWQYSVAKAERALGLEGQPRAVVSHIYEGKEHLHVVWSRVDVEQRKCAELSFSHLKLCQAAREIEIELGLQQTPERARGPRKLKQHVQEIERHQDERTGQSREQRNALIQAAWDNSQTGQEFQAQIEAIGLRLALGRRGVLVLDGDNEPHSISRCVKGIRAKDVRAKLADVGDLPSVEELRGLKATGPIRQRARHLTREELNQLVSNDNAPQNITPEQARHLTQAEFERRVLKP